MHRAFLNQMQSSETIKDEDKKDSKEKIVDPIKDYVEQCNAENDGGDAKLQQEKDENTIQADFKQEIISRRSSKRYACLKIGI